jgi:hypothetical protein
LIEIGGILARNRLMQALKVVPVDEVIEAGLRLQEVARGRLVASFLSVRCMRSSGRSVQE